MLIDATKSSLLIVDVQERLLPVMAAGNGVVERSKILLKAAKALDVPIAVSEQYPKGLGHTVEILSQEIGNAPVFEKTSFSCWRDEGLRRHFTRHHDGGRPQVIIAGIEAHVCVAQTAIDLAQAGFGVFVAISHESGMRPLLGPSGYCCQAAERVIRSATPSQSKLSSNGARSWRA